MKVRTLTLLQTYDPARGSFIVKDKKVAGKKLHGKQVYVTPCETGRDGNVTTYSNSFEFVVS
jgi:hypothetical protein